MLVHEGAGLVNSLINKLPVELHIPGYNYCGPGTKLRERLRRGDPGINPLDEACKSHDIAYSQNRDLESRHRADAILAERAWERVKSKDARFGEKAAAWAVTNIMKVKRKTGMGSRVDRKVPLNKILYAAREAVKRAKPTTLKTASEIAMGAARVALRKAGGRKNIRALPRVIPISGGFLPFLPALFAGLSAVGALAGGASTVAKAVNAAKGAREKLEEMKRHNQKMEAIAVGRGLYVGKRKCGYGLYLGKKPKNL